MAEAVRAEGAVLAVLFDLDGTLVDSHPALKAAYRRFLSGHGASPTDAEYERWNGPPLSEIVRGLAATHNLPGDPAALLDEYLAILEGSYLSDARLAIGAIPLLDALRAAGVLLAVVTSGPARLANAMLEARGVRDRFQTVVCGDEVARGKPDPEPYREACRRLGVKSSEALAIEDTEIGVRAAVAAGVTCLGVGPAGARLLGAGASEIGGTLAALSEVIEARAAGAPGRVWRGSKLVVRVIGEAPSLDAAMQQKVDAAWDAAKKRRPQLVDGEVLSVVRFERVSDEVVTVETERVRYRRFVARRMGIPTGVRPLGVSGVTVLAAASGEPQLVLGRRAALVTQHPGCWELIPSGGVPCTRARDDGSVDVEGQLLEELAEELGVAKEAVRTIAPLGLVEDLDERVIDLCFRIEVDGPNEEGLRAHLFGSQDQAEHAEYDRLALIAAGTARDFIRGWAAAGERMVPTVEPLLSLLDSKPGRGEDRRGEDRRGVVTTSRGW